MRISEVNRRSVSVIAKRCALYRAYGIISGLICAPPLRGFYKILDEILLESLPSDAPQTSIQRIKFETNRIHPRTCLIQSLCVKPSATAKTRGPFCEKIKISDIPPSRVINRAIISAYGSQGVRVVPFNRRRRNSRMTFFVSRPISMRQRSTEEASGWLGNGLCTYILRENITRVAMQRRRCIRHCARMTLPRGWFLLAISEKKSTQ